MKTSTLTVKIKPELKKKAKEVAEDLGFSLSALVNGYIADLVRTKAVHFGERPLIPTERLKQAIKEADEDRKNGWVSPSFDNAEDAIAWLDDPDAKYVRDK